MPSKRHLRSTFHYDPQSGKLYRKIRQGNKLAGTEAGCVATGTGTHAKRKHILVRLDNKLYLAHRIIWVLHNGNIPKGLIIDHINHNPCDNRLENLRLITYAESAQNLPLRCNNKSGVHGVRFRTDRRKWEARIALKGKIDVLGHFLTFSDAVAARKAAEARLGFHPNHGRSSSPTPV